jgi:phosphatidylglycerol:prolipoprotein diacylglycerol transferase
VFPLLSLPAVIVLSFDPIATIGGWSVRLETLALAVVLLAALVVAARIGASTPVDVSRPPDAAGDQPDEPNHLRADDLLYIAVASLPGAVVGGRIGYVLLHLDYYRANAGAILDVSQGSFQLSLAIVGGTLTAAIVATLLGAPVGRWLHATILPLLLAIAGGKAAQVLGGDGQGMPFDGGWATAYLGAGPWGSLAPALPSHPSQAYEALATAGVAVVLMALLGAGAFSRRGGGAFVLGLGLWAAARALVATTWRDPPELGPLNADQVISLVIVVIALAILVVAAGRAAREARRTGVRAGDGPVVGGGAVPAASTAGDAHEDAEWPDPASRPRF